MPSFGAKEKAERVLEALQLVGDKVSRSLVVIGDRVIRRRSLPSSRA